MDGPPRQPRLGNLTVTKPVPNFLRQFQAPPESSIEEAIRRRAEEKREEDRPEAEDEAPVVVDEADALPSGQRGGSLRFKGDDRSAAAKFVASAHRSAAEHDETQMAAAADSAVEKEASGAHVYRAAAPKKEKKRKPARDGLPAAKAIKKPGLLSFNDEEE